MGTVAETLAGFAHSLRFEDLPQAVIHEAKRRIIAFSHTKLVSYTGYDFNYISFFFYKKLKVLNIMF
jgi:hypothetical protein